jgi:hypothetical protein
MGFALIAQNLIFSLRPCFCNTGLARFDLHEHIEVAIQLNIGYKVFSAFPAAT